MGATKIKNGNNKIVFHVGKSLPDKGENILLVPGRQNSQGKGLYCSGRPLLKFAGGEHYRERPERIPVFCVPMSGGNWVATCSKNSGEMAYHSMGKAIVLKNIQYIDTVQDEDPVRIYFSDDVSTFQMKYFGPGTRRIEDEEESFLERVRRGQLNFEQAMEQLKMWGIAEVSVDKELIDTSLHEAVREGRLVVNEGELKEGLGKKHDRVERLKDFSLGLTFR